jgi:predicted Zn-dependent protease
VPDEWYRSPGWDDAARVEFEHRLSRARAHNRPQYLKIKALALADAGLLDEAKALLTRLTSQYPDSLDAPYATELLGDVARRQRRAEDAERHYRAVVAGWSSLNATSGMVEVSLAELLAERGDRKACEEALGLLERWLHRGGLRFNSQLFRWHLALVATAGRLGDHQTVQHAARTALSLVDRDPQLPRHPTVGLVEADEHTLTRLRQLAGDGPSGPGSANGHGRPGRRWRFVRR